MDFSLRVMLKGSVNLRREVITWAGLACAALVLLAAILHWQQKTTRAVRGAIYLSADTAAGSQIFKSKGCVNCHGSVNNTAGGLATASGQRPSRNSLPKLVTAMWNHAPRMWERMSAEKLTYPELNYQETAQLVSYLYMTGYMDTTGDPAVGQTLFHTKRCVRCHAVNGAGSPRGPDLGSTMAINNPMLWTEVMWNHASGMESSMEQVGLAWPRFQEDELRDLFAYVRSINRRPLAELDVSPADPENGWKVFQSKGCVNCHSLNASGQGHIGPDLGRDANLPPTFFRFGELMLNHFPNMRRAMKVQGSVPPTLQGQEMADVIAFVYSLRYLEPGGSPHVGESVFAWRGCGRCHGVQAEGNKNGPPLRGRGQSYTAIRLASVLWRHGARMYNESQKMGQGWPELQPSDIGDMLAFLNAPLEK